MKDLDDCVGETDAGQKLGLSPRTLQHYRVTGEGPPYTKLGGTNGPVRYRLRDLDSYIEQRLRRSTSDEGVQGSR